MIFIFLLRVDEEMPVSPVVSVFVIGLIMDASIPGGAGSTARDAAWADRKGGTEE